MKTVVVQAHPLDDSYSMALLDAALAGLAARGDEPRVLRISSGDLLDASSLSGATHLVMIYPTWWGAAPAMLLGPVVELLTPWIDGDAQRSNSPLRSIERLTIVTSHGSSRLVNGLQGEPGRQLWSRTVLGLCAPGASLDWVALYKMDRLDAVARNRFAEQVTQRLSA